MPTMTTKRREELEMLVRRLRRLVFDADEARAAKAGRVLRLVRARLEEAGRPEREAAARSREAEEAAKREYARRATTKPRRCHDEAAETAAYEEAAGGRARAGKLVRLLEYVTDNLVPDPFWEKGDPTSIVRSRLAGAARREGYPPEAVARLLAIRGML